MPAWRHAIRRRVPYRCPMTKADALSAVMVAALDLADQHGGKLVRYQGGYWAPGGRSHPSINGGEHAGTSTVEALVARGRMAYTQHRAGRRPGNPFPVEATVMREANVVEHPATCEAISQPRAML